MEKEFKINSPSENASTSAVRDIAFGSVNIYTYSSFLLHLH